MTGVEPGADQLANAAAADGVTYINAPAEQTTLPDGGCSAVVVAQALHWFDFARFFTEVRRILKPSGIFACWVGLFGHGIVRTFPLASGLT